MTILDSLSDSNKTRAQKISEKSDIIFAIGSIPKTNVLKTKIEVLSIEKTVYGADVYARAWDKQDNPIGFGDGTVEIERFKLVMNDLLGYIVVHDKNGTLEITDTEGTITKVRIDPKQALLNRLDSVIASTGTLNAQIQIGKVGKTTTVVDYSSTNSKQATQDGIGTYSGAHDATTGTIYVLDSPNTHNILHNSKISTLYYVRRADLQFDTSSIPDTDTITGLTLTLYANATSGADTDAYSVSFLDNTNNGNLSSPIVSEDFNDFGTTAIISKDLTDYFNIGANVTSQDFGDYSVVNKTGTTRIGLRLSGDISNSTPTGSNVLRVGTGASGDDPFITVTHSAATSTFIPRVSFIM